MEAARVEGEAQLEALGQSHCAASERAAEAAAARLAEAAAELGRVRAQAAAQAAVAARRESELERERDTAQHMLQMLAQRADEREGAWAEREGAWAAGQRQLQAELGAEEGRRRAEMATQKELRVRLGEAERATVAAEAGRAGHDEHAAALSSLLGETNMQLGAARAEAVQRRGVSLVLDEARMQSRAQLEATRGQLAEAKGQLAAFCQARPHLRSPF